MMYKNYAKIRDSKGLTDYAIAKGTGISSGTFGDWEKGSNVMEKIYSYNLDPEESQKDIATAFDSLLQ